MLGLPQDKTIFLYAGYLDRRKGITELLEAFNRIQRRCNDTILVLCGSGNLTKWVGDYIREQRIEGQVFLQGAVDPDEMHLWMQASDIFVLASYSEGMPNVVMEAMACGVAVIATRVGGVPDALEGCKGAILIEPKSVRALESAMESVLTDRAALRQMCIAARSKATTDFEVQENSRRILDYLAGVRDDYRSKS